MSLLSLIILIIIGVIAYNFREELMAAAAFIGIFAGVGALLFWWWFDKPSLGAIVGCCLAVIIGSKIILQSRGERYSNVFGVAFRFISFPIWFLNRLQHILMEPWRYLTKNYIYSSPRKIMLLMAYPIEIILYILITPLRFLNAVLYNIFVYCISELYDLTLEVFVPGSYDEGKGSFWGWIIWFPVRVVKYPIFHGFLVIIEAMVWTVIDVFIPTVTMYHGTDLTSANAIVGNDWNSAYNRKWTDGTFSASQHGWAGAGVYFGSRRKTAEGYAHDPHRLSDNNPVMIVCRVSLGKVLNYRLAPPYIHDNTGEYGDNSVINVYAEAHGYDTGEWWNEKGGYWEFCMFDWQNRYNHPWRIRPIFVFNFRTGVAQHIDGGFRHWLFSRSVLTDFFNNWWFLCVAGFSIGVVIGFLYGVITGNINWDKYIHIPHKTEIQNSMITVPEYTDEDYAAVEVGFEDVYNGDSPAYHAPSIEGGPVVEYVRPIKSSKKSYPRKSKPFRDANPTEPIQQKSKYGFKLERVDKIPDPADYGVH